MLVPAGRRFDWPKVRAHLGVNRLSLPDADEAHAVTGYERCTITPFGATRAWPVIADASIVRTRHGVAIGGGAHGVNLHLAPADLVAALGAERRRRHGAGGAAARLTGQTACHRTASVWHDRSDAEDPAALPILASPIIRRVAWHVRRVARPARPPLLHLARRGDLASSRSRRSSITLLEKPTTIESFFDSFNWGIATVLGQGNADFVTSPGGRVVGWLLILFGVAMLGMITGALVAMVIDFLLKEGQGLGASGHGTTSSCAAGTAPPVT